KKEALSTQQLFSSLKNKRLVICLFFTTMIIQVATGSVTPILTLYIRDLAGSISNLAFISGVIASVPGIAALI
ncbi:multidrug transporter subunit MdtG, partial [Enterobacter hormaechei]